MTAACTLLLLLLLLLLLPSVIPSGPGAVGAAATAAFCNACVCSIGVTLVQSECCCQ
jgi:hypothetical protein